MAEEVIHGLNEFVDDLGKLSLRMARIHLVRAGRAAAEPIQKRMERDAPDDPTTPGSQQRENFDANVANQTASGIDIFVGPTSAGFIAGFSELGTAHQPARPYIGPAFDETLDEALQIFGLHLGDAIEKELKKIG